MMRRRLGALALVRGRDADAAVGHGQVVQDAAEQLERGLGLVVRHLVAGRVDAREAEVAVLPRLAVLVPLDHERRVARGSELRRVRVVDLQGYGLAAVPVTDVVLVKRSVHAVAHVRWKRVLTASP